MESLNLFNTQYPTLNIQPVKDWIQPWILDISLLAGRVIGY